MSTQRPPVSVLRNLYEVQRLSTREIGTQFGVSKTSVLRWMRQYGIAARPHDFWLKAQQGARPNAETLRRLVHEEHHSYEEIGDIYGVSGSAIKFWVDRYGIERPTIWGTRRKGYEVTLPTFPQLWSLYVDQQLSTIEIGRRFNTTAGMIADACREAGIPLRHSGFDGSIRYTCNDGNEVASASEVLVANWLIERNIPYTFEPELPFDNAYGRKMYRADFVVNGWYVEVWGVKGNARYDERRAFKVSAYHRHGLPLVELPAEAFISGLWEQVLHRVLIHPTIRIESSDFQ